MIGNIWANLLWKHTDALLYSLIAIGALALCYFAFHGIKLAAAKNEGQGDKAKLRLRHGILGFVILFMAAPTLLMVGCTEKDTYLYTLSRDSFQAADIGEGIQIYLIQGSNQLPADDKVEFIVLSADSKLDITPRGLLTIAYGATIEAGSSEEIIVSVKYRNDEKIPSRKITVHNPSDYEVKPPNGNGGEPIPTEPMAWETTNPLFKNPVNFVNTNSVEEENKGFGYGSTKLPYVTTFFGKPILGTYTVTGDAPSATV